MVRDIGYLPSSIFSNFPPYLMGKEIPGRYSELAGITSGDGSVSKNLNT